MESASVIESLYVGIRSSYQLSHNFWCVQGWGGQRKRLGFQLSLTFQAFAEIALLLSVEILDRKVALRDLRHIFSYSKISPSKPNTKKPSVIN